MLKCKDSQTNISFHFTWQEHQSECSEWQEHQSECSEFWAFVSMPADADRLGARATPPPPVPKKNSAGPHFTKRTTCPQHTQNICRAKNAKAKKEWVNERIPSITQKSVRNTSVHEPPASGCLLGFLPERGFVAAMLILFLLRSWHATNTLFQVSLPSTISTEPADQHIALTDQPACTPRLHHTTQPSHSHKTGGWERGGWGFGRGGRGDWALLET